MFHIVILFIKLFWISSHKTEWKCFPTSFDLEINWSIDSIEILSKFSEFFVEVLENFNWNFL